jgi:DNA segregation ATPase FtsK/SpoIIIE, S-DNA-T family
MASTKQPRTKGGKAANNKPAKAGKGSAAAKSTPAKGGSKGGRAKPRGRGTGAQQPLQPGGLSLDRKLDIIGIMLFFLGLILALSLMTAQSGNLLTPLVTAATQLAGWGRLGLPLGLIAVGLWLVLRRFGDRLPRLEPERLVGLALLYLALLTSLHFYAAESQDVIFRTVETGRGGGIIGAAILSVLHAGLGELGTAVLLAAWWIIAVMFTAGLSVPELILLVGGFIGRLRDAVRRPRAGAPAPAAPERTPAAEPQRGAAAAARRAAATKQAPATTGQPAATATPARTKPGAAAAEPAFPAPAASPAPPYDQPLVIGGDQPWVLPGMEDMLDVGTETGADDEFDRQRANTIESTLASFGAPVRVVEVNRGPTITQFGVEPDFVEQRSGKRTKVKVGKIAALADDLALALSAHSIRIEAPVPGKGYVGIEVPNMQTSLVSLRDVMESEHFDRLHGTLRLGLGQDVSGTPIAANLANMPHLLIAGTTGSGKSVCVNSIITCLLLQNTPDQLKFVMVDPKRVELTSYNGIPHLLAPVVVELERVVASLQWVTREMDERYRKFAKSGVRNIDDYNERQAAANEKPLPYLIVIIDELADLMMLAPDETERTITRLAQLARATGIHLIIATQRPSVDVVTGLIKANFPARIAFAVASGVDSRVILDQPGAERLLGRGDMLFQSPDAAAPLRMQGVFVSDSEIQRIVRYWKGARGVEMLEATSEAAASVGGAQAPEVAGAAAQPPRQQPLWDSGPFAEAETRADGEDELLQDAIAAVREMKKASISLLQRRLRIGYTRAARLIDVLEERGIIGPAESGAKPREVIDYGDQASGDDIGGSAGAAAGAAPEADDEKRTWTSE